MNNQNRPKANYHLLATVATLGPVRGGICSDKSLRTRSEATQGVWGIRSPVPPRGLSRSDWGGEENCSELGAPSETLQGGDNSLYLPLIVLLTIIAYI